MKHPSARPAADRGDPARRAPSRHRRCRDGDDLQIVATIEVLNMGAVPAEQEVAGGIRAGGTARVSAPRTVVRHVEVLVMEQQLTLLILGDLDP